MYCVCMCVCVHVRVCACVCVCADVLEVNHVNPPPPLPFQGVGGYVHVFHYIPCRVLNMPRVMPVLPVLLGSHTIHNTMWLAC